MKALLSLKSAINQSRIVGIMALVALLPVLFPHLVALADNQTLGSNSAQIFEIKVTDSSLLDSAPKQNDTQNTISFNDIQQADPLTVNLQAFLQDNNSPLQGYVPQLLSHDNWPTIVAISFVESNMCVHSYYHNCSGIGGQQYLRKYQDYGQWIDDMSNILSTRYNGWSLAKMDGVYVQPYSPNWKLGSTNMLNQLTKLEDLSNQQRAEIAQAQTQQLQQNLALNTFPVSNP